MQLREQEPAAIADVGVVLAELVTVIAQRQRLGEVAGQRLEARQMGDPLRLGPAAKTDPLRPPPIDKARHRRGKRRGRDGIVEIRA